jgi:hypothetical protein
MSNNSVPYSKAVRSHAVNLYKSGKTLAEVSSLLGPSKIAIYTWVKAAGWNRSRVEVRGSVSHYPCGHSRTPNNTTTIKRATLRSDGSPRKDEKKCKTCRIAPEYSTVARHHCYIFNGASHHHYLYAGLPFFTGWNPQKGGSYQAGAQWIVENLGKKPGLAWSIDIIKRELGFVPGNLRWATRRTQQTNRYNNRKYPGVELYGSGRARARIGVNGVTINLGAFKSERDASTAYRAAVRKYDYAIAA